MRSDNLEPEYWRVGVLGVIQIYDYNPCVRPCENRIIGEHLQAGSCVPEYYTLLPPASFFKNI